MRRALALTAVAVAVVLTAVGVATIPRAAGPPPVTRGAIVRAVATAATTPALYSGDPAQTPTVSTSTRVVTAAAPEGAVRVTLPTVSKSTVTAATATSTAAGIAQLDAKVITTGVQTVVTPGVGGVGISEVIPGPADPTRYKYKLDLPRGYRLYQEPTPASASNSGLVDQATAAGATSAGETAVSGGTNSGTPPQSTPITAGTPGNIVITDAKAGTAPSASTIFGIIAPPTAVDALGNKLTTSYSISGKNVLWQSVALSQAQAFPVTIDPEVTFGSYIYVYWSYGDIGNILANGWFGGVWAEASAACGFLAGAITAASGGLLFVVGGIVLAVCTFLVFAATWLVNWLFETARARGGGIVWKFLYSGEVVGYLYAGSWS
jgi:hypothetical protein